MFTKVKECVMFIWLMIWILPSLPGLIEQGKYEEDLQSGKIG
jgi:hypothetical protein